jgi:hypothetical protein
VHTLFPRPRRHYRLSRSPPTIVRRTHWPFGASGFSNHFLAPALRCGQPGQQQGRRLPSLSSANARWILRLRVVVCLAEMIQQIHSFRASGVRSLQTACVVASELIALRRSAGVLCRGPSLVSLFTISATPSVRRTFVELAISVNLAGELIEALAKWH